MKRPTRRALEDVELVFHEAAHSFCAALGREPARDASGVRRGDLRAARSPRASVTCGASSTPLRVPPTATSRRCRRVEEMRPDPLSPYAVAKLVGEYYCQVFHARLRLRDGLPALLQRLRPDGKTPARSIRASSRASSARLLTGERPVIYGDGEQSRDFTYISNVVDANLRAAETTQGLGQVINIANGEATTLNQLVDTLKQMTGKTDMEAEYREPRLGDVRHSLADITRAQTLLGYETRVALEEGLGMTVDWYAGSRYVDK